MSNTTSIERTPGWYVCDGDPSGTSRWWNGDAWSEPQAWRQKSQENRTFQEPKKVKWPNDLYALAIIMPIGGVIAAIVRFAKQDVANGLGLLLTSFVAVIVWSILLTSI